VCNVIHLPFPVNPLGRLDDEITALSTLVAGVRARAASDEAFDFADAEREIHEAIARTEVAALAQVMEAAQPRTELIEVEGEVYKRIKTAATAEYLARSGEVRIERHLYRRVGVQNGPTVDPIALRCGLVQGRMTPAAASAFGHLNQAVPSREAADLCASLGVLPYSRSALHRNGRVVGEAWDRLAPSVQTQMVQTMEIPQNAVSVSVSVDRVSLPMAEDRPLTERDIKRGIKRPVSVSLRMAFCGVWTLHDAEGEALHTVRYAHIPEGGAEMIESVLTSDLRVLLARRPDLRVVTLADGAAEMQNILDRVMVALGVTPAAVLVDFWHLGEKLGGAARASGHDVKATTHRFCCRLLADDAAIEEIEVELMRWSSGYGDELPDGLYDALTYIDNQRERLRFASVRAAGLPIGSGHVEATCKTIVSVRFKRSGARWRPDGAQPVLGLRALATSSRWRPAMKLLTDSYIRPFKEAG